MNSDGVVRFLTGTQSPDGSAQVQLAYDPRTINRTANTGRLKDALVAVRIRHVLLACTLLVTFVLALSAFIMAFDDEDRATASPAITAAVVSKENVNQTSLPSTTDRPIAMGAATGLSAGPSVPKCGANWQRFETKCYRMTSRTNFAGVEAECIRNFKGSLVSVHDEKENAFIAMFARTSHAAENEFYIGLTRNFTGHWVWFDGSALSYIAWKSAEPSGNSTSDHCVQVSTTFGPMSGRWEVVSCDTQRPAVCKRDLTNFGEEEEPDVLLVTSVVVEVQVLLLVLAKQDDFESTLEIFQISSPNYPGNYGDNEEVLYRLVASSPGSVVVLTFATIQTEPDRDLVIVYDGIQLNDRELKTYSGVHPGDTVVRSTGQYMTVRLRTDSSITFRGFTATFTSQNVQ